MPIPFIATEISGLTIPQYASGAANKLYVDTISGALDARIDALAGIGTVTFSPLTATSQGGIAPLEGTIAVSGSTAVSLEVEGYSTISGAAHYAKAEILASGAKYHSAYAWYAASAQKLSQIEESGAKYTAAYAWYTASAQKLSSFEASGDKYSKAVLSSQALKDGAFLKVTQGYASVADNGTIAHLLGVVPKAVQLTPSGNVSFALAYKADATNITVRMSAAGSRVVSWRAEA